MTEFEVEAMNESIEFVLEQDHAEVGDRYIDDFGNVWLVDDDREGFRIHIEGQPDAWVPYWTARNIGLPGFRLLTR